MQPLLDYCSQLWPPHKRGDIQLLKGIQRAYTKQIRGMRDLSYWDRLRELGLYPQQRRRDRYRVIYMWKILERQLPNPAPLALLPYTTERIGRKCSRKILPTRAPERIRTLLASSLTYEGSRLPCTEIQVLCRQASADGARRTPKCRSILPDAGPTTPYRIKWTSKIGTPGSGAAVDYHGYEEILKTIPRIPRRRKDTTGLHIEISKGMRYLMLLPRWP